VPGRVILQTYNPSHFSITAAREQDYEAFFRQEIEFRKALGYPPVTRMVQIRLSGQDKAKVAACARRLAEAGEKIKLRSPLNAPEMLGPIEAPLQRIAGRHRWQLLIKHPRTDQLHQFVRRLLFGPDTPFADPAVTIIVDVDPVFLM
jgi:primosomal protein N' (replication factor Y) (superfamily II helicase)